jgi:hypothetical protein
MNVALVTDSRHRDTSSHKFLTELLARHVQICLCFHGEVSEKAGGCVERVLATSPDLILLLGTHHCISDFAKSGHPNIVLLPMCDGSKLLEDADLLSLKRIKVLSFSFALQERLHKADVLTRTFQYYPDPTILRRITDYSELRGFFSQRSKEFDWGHVRTLVKGNRFRSFTVNLPTNSGWRAAVTPTLRERLFQNVAVTNCGKTQTDYHTLLENANFLIAPGSNGDIGEFFLEAMGMGIAVAAPDIPTMNEYITHQVNGYLFDARSLDSLNLSRFREAGKRARETIEIGHIAWKASCPDLLDFLFTSTRILRKPASRVAIPPKQHLEKETLPALPSEYVSREAQVSLNRLTGGIRISGSRKADFADKPLITVAIVVLNARDAFRSTILSVLSQSYEHLELLVIDGGSVDGTLDAIRQYGNAIDLWISEKDEGPYFAMNKAAQLAAGRWIIFMNAGDWFLNAEAISNAVRYAPKNADFIIGHHVYRTEAGIEELHKANDPAISWDLLQGGKLDGHWLLGIPGHQATFTRLNLLREHGYNTTFRIAADHDFFYRMKKKGCSFYHCGIPLSVYNGGGFSTRNSSLCISEWERTCVAHSDEPENVREFFAGVLAYDRRKQPSSFGGS